MLEGHGVARGLCLVGILGILIAGTGCGQIEEAEAGKSAVE